MQEEREGSESGRGKKLSERDIVLEISGISDVFLFYLITKAQIKHAIYSMKLPTEAISLALA